jgi:hypothetical protein
MPTFYRADTRTWKYVPYRQADAPTRGAFREKAKRQGWLEEGASGRFRCCKCGREWELDELGAAFGDEGVGTPLCPGEGCSGIGWDYLIAVG